NKLPVKGCRFNMDLVVRVRGVDSVPGSAFVVCLKRNPRRFDGLEVLEIEAGSMKRDRPIGVYAFACLRFTLGRNANEPSQLTIHVQVGASHTGYVQRRFIELYFLNRVEITRTLTVPVTIGTWRDIAHFLPALG